MTTRYLTPNLRLVFLKLQDDERNMRIMERGERNNGELYSNNGSDESDDEEEGSSEKISEEKIKKEIRFSS